MKQQESHSTAVEDQFVPAGWRRLALGDVGKIVSGITLGRKAGDGKRLRSVPYLRVANVKDGYLDLSEVFRIDATVDEIEKLSLKPGDLLLTEGGDPDKLGRGTFWQGELPECIHQNHIFRVRFNPEEFVPEFLSAQFASPYGKAYFLAHSKRTTGIATINQKVLAGFPLLVPPFTVQQRIARVVREQMAAVERARAAAGARLEAAKALPGAYLRNLLHRPTHQPWPSRRLGDLLRETRNGLYKPEQFYGAGTPVVKMFNIGRFDGAWYLERLDRVRVSPEEMASYSLEVEDLVVNRVNSRELVGKCAVIGQDLVGCVFESKNMRIRIDPASAVPGYIALWLNGIKGREQIQRRLRQIVGMATINRSDIETLQVDLPPLPDQEQIVNIHGGRVVAANRARKAVEGELAAIEALPGAILGGAFSGEL